MAFTFRRRERLGRSTYVNLDAMGIPPGNVQDAESDVGTWTSGTIRGSAMAVSSANRSARFFTVADVGQGVRENGQRRCSSRTVRARKSHAAPRGKSGVGYLSHRRISPTPHVLTKRLIVLTVRPGHSCRRAK